MNCYFDTSIYNQILDDPNKDKIVQKIREKQLTTIPSLVNLCEIIMTPDAERKQKLLSIYNEIRDDYYALKPFTVLLRDAMLAIQKGEAEIDVNMAVVEENTERLCRDALEDTGKGFDEYALKAREWLFSEYKSSDLPDAKTFFKISYERRMIPIWRKIIEGAIEGLGIKDLIMSDEFVLQTVTNSKSIWKYFLDTYLLIFHRRAMRSEGHGKKSNPGGADLIQGLYLAWADIFVIKDDKFNFFMKELKELQGYQKEIFTYDEFKEYLIS